MTSSERPVLRVIDADATPEEVAAIVAAVAAALASARARAVAAQSAPTSRWVDAARLGSRRSGRSRGEWRLSGRIGRRARA